LGRACSKYGEKRHFPAGARRVNVNGIDHSEGLRVDGRIILNWILKKYDEVARTGIICLRSGKSGGPL
jgi:hypothetical protein